MRKVTFVSVCLLCITLIAPQLFAADNEATAKKLVEKLPADEQRPKYYTGTHSFMNDKDLTSDGGALEKGLYLMSWLATNPPVKVVANTGGTASMGKPLYKDYFGIAEEDVSKNSRNWPYAGLKSKKPNTETPLKDRYIYWIPMNFQDMVDAGETEGFGSGNEFDWKEWAGSFRALEDFHIYIYSAWSSGIKVPQ